MATTGIAGLVHKYCTQQLKRLDQSLGEAEASIKGHKAEAERHHTLAAQVGDDRTCSHPEETRRIALDWYRQCEGHERQAARAGERAFVAERQAHVLERQIAKLEEKIYGVDTAFASNVELFESLKLVAGFVSGPQISIPVKQANSGQQLVYDVKREDRVFTVRLAVCEREGKRFPAGWSNTRVFMHVQVPGAAAGDRVVVLNRDGSPLLDAVAKSA